MRPFQSIQIEDERLNRVQDNVRNAINPLLALPISDGTLLKEISLTAGQDNLISHKLTRTPVLWMIARQSANSAVWEDATKTDRNFLCLLCSTSCTVSLWVA